MPPDLAKACEIVFQEHKTSADPIPWNKDIFRGRLSLGMSEKAKETLLNKNVIYYPNKAKRLLTMINPEVATASNFEEAIAWAIIIKPAEAATQILVSPAVAKRKPVPTAISVSYPQTNPAPVLKEVAKPAQYVYVSQASPNKQQHSSAELKWHLKPVYYYGLWLAAAAVMGAVIAWLLGNLASAI